MKLRELINVLPDYEVVKIKIRLSDLDMILSDIIAKYYNEDVTHIQRDVDGLIVWFEVDDDSCCEFPG